MPNKAGLYLHIPFCEKKCAYCDFYSAFVTNEGLDRYVGAVQNEIKRWGGSFGRPIDTVYIGGGTPSLLGKRIIPLLDTVREYFDISPDAEITAEVNPSADCMDFLSAARAAGVNRLSVGVQSANADELEILGRRHTAADAESTVFSARELGFDNITVDLMLALPESNAEKLNKSIDFALSLRPQHLSAYILKIERNTPFGRRYDLSLPDEDACAGQYLLLCERMKEAGFEHYEISNFAKPRFESRHNLKYWRCEEYLGIGPSAHSYLDGKRFYYPRDLGMFIKNPQITGDGAGGDENEKIMLALRLSSGYDFKGYPDILNYLSALERAGLGMLCGSVFSLTERGMLVSNSVITEILERL